MKVKISVIKFEVVNGKKTGKAFSFKMDPEEMAPYKTEATVRKKVAEYVAKCGIYKPEELKDLKYSMNDFLEEWKKLKPAHTVPEPTARNYELERFLTAQDRDYDAVVEELGNGCKRSHWIWYIFPQQKGLGHSYNSEYYGLEGEEEAKAYLAHPVLGERLRECCRLLLSHKDRKGIDAIMGSEIDVLKLQTCMNLFNRISPDDIFETVLDTFF